MKNLSLFLILITITTFAYFINNENKDVIRDLSSIESIKSLNYEITKGDKSIWICDNRKVDVNFMNTFTQVLGSLELVQASKYQGKTFGELKIFYKTNKDHYVLGEKVFSNNGIYLKVNSKWFIVKVNFTKDIVYKDDNDLALKQYDILYNIFNFSKDIILKNTTNKP